ncbi:hypothetical protein I4U23_015174 [Adineta vaga]|nr:hypothetical protein I4U23_015174 [Adineta vaga]
MFFKKTNIINHDEHWVGGLFSFACAVLFGFTCWFAFEFLSLYSFETSHTSYFSCEDTVTNSLFESALQLPLSSPDGHQWAIIDMLDNQLLTMTVDLLNTAVNCSDITVQQNIPEMAYVLLAHKSCIVQRDNVTRSITFDLPIHLINIQINTTGPYFIGGIRLCLRGLGRIEGVHTLQTLDTCHLVLPKNETLLHITTCDIAMIKVINLTKPLNIGNDILYHGRWSLSFAKISLSNALFYEPWTKCSISE